MPKTGGTSIQRDLKFQFPSGIHVSNSKRDDAWRSLVNRLRPGSNELIRGHLTGRHREDLLQEGHSVRAICYLRDPFDRLLSEFIWRKNKYPSRYPERLDKFSFESFIDAKPGDAVCRLMVGECSGPDEALQKVTYGFWFVGITEYYHICQAVLMAALGKEYRIRRRLNTSPQHDRVAEIKQHYLQSVREKFACDFAIYEFFKSRWQARINDVVESLMLVNRKHSMFDSDQTNSIELTPTVLPAALTSHGN